jgi:hypothetical protein
MFDSNAKAKFAQVTVFVIDSFCWIIKSVVLRSTICVRDCIREARQSPKTLRRKVCARDGMIVR